MSTEMQELETSQRTLSVQELAESTGETIKTIRYYQNIGLLLPPVRRGRLAFYNAEHQRSIAEIRRLKASGWSLKAIRQRFDEGDTEGATRRASALLGGRYTIEDLTSATALPLQVLEALRDEGILEPSIDCDGAYYTNADLALARLGIRMLGYGVPLPTLLSLARRFAEATRDLIGESIGIFEDAVRLGLRGSRDPEEDAQRTLEDFDALYTTAADLVTLYFQKTLASRALERLAANGTDEERAIVRARIDLDDDGASSYV